MLRHAKIGTKVLLVICSVVGVSIGILGWLIGTKVQKAIKERTVAQLTEGTGEVAARLQRVISRTFEQFNKLSTKLSNIDLTQEDQQLQLVKKFFLKALMPSALRSDT
ncbi:hypothetical protein ACFOPX_06160 [Helicobacter baculiformis]|uniref:Methyl-accepting chemotaxis protein n=1 Tax=Helicobacter baculiformis TaxID=427351 RepID=A0ABV7ZIT4_9HELI|nr:hypothetical protein [Helicobacter baculiformis]